MPDYRDLTWQDWGTFVHLGVADGARLAAARELTEQLMAEIGGAISRFDAGSELCRANSRTGEWVSAGRLLVEFTEVALAAARQTDGLVDPTLGRVLSDLGYDTDLDEVRARGAGRRPTDLPELIHSGAPGAGGGGGGWRGVRTAPGRILVPHGVGLDLGATGKALAADRISSAIATELDLDCILSLGGDVAVGRTGTGPAAPTHPWKVSVAERPGEPPATVIPVPSGGVATSTTTHRSWRQGDRLMHHLLDPATGRPVRRHWRTATVIAADALSANVAATAALVLGERAGDWLAARSLAARLVAQDGAVLTLPGWPQTERPRPAEHPERPAEQVLAR